MEYRKLVEKEINEELFSDFICHQMVEILYQKYKTELQSFEGLDFLNQDSFASYINKSLEECSVRILVEAEEVKGVMIYNCYEDDSKVFCKIPLYGYGAIEQEEKYVSMLFQKIAEEVRQIANGKEISFSIHLYAHDIKIQRLFSYMQFGFQLEVGLRKVSEHRADTKFRMKALTKKELLEKWEQVWSLTKAIVEHLKESPIFYPGEEFTEELYHDFYFAEGTVVYAAFNENSEIIGIIETNAESQEFVFGDTKVANIGEVFVIPEYRGSGLAEELLFFAEHKVCHKGNSWLWVEHGTANPNARGFWNRYFDTYSYEMIRKIDM